MKKVAIVTGGSRGIGREICLFLAAGGFEVIVNFLSNSKAADEVVALIKERGGNAIAVGADVSTDDGADKLLNAAKENFGGIDLLVNNAGITRDNLLVRMSDTEWNEVLQTNLAAIINLSEKAIELFKERGGGKIINITSTVGVHGNAGQANYAAAKSALISYTKIKARELMPTIQVNAIAPGLVRTDMTAKFELDKLADTKLGRAALPSDIAACAQWLASSGGDYVTGQVIEIDGGLFLWSDVEALAR